MEKRDRATLTFGLGAYLSMNGGLLLCSPGRFAGLHQATWIPEPVNRVLGRARAHWPAARVGRDGFGVARLVGTAARLRPPA